MDDQSSFFSKVQGMHRIVHLDLKGAPPKIDYLKKVLLCIKSWGATGVLFEWEDTFPYTSDLWEIGSDGGCGGDDVYSIEEVKRILKFASKNGLICIQLIQTIGHMEYVLKHPKYKSLRESPQYPAVLCPSKPGSKLLVQAMLEQVLDAQPDAEFLHIGADEVWHIGVCAQCQRTAASHPDGSAALYLDHVQDVVMFLKRKKPNLTVLMWDDMLRNINIDVLQKYEMCRVVEPVVWHYNSKDSFQINPQIWENYRQLYSKVWAGSAYKGANGSCQILSPVNRYVSNHEAWINEINMNHPRTHFAGIILTGWSRYDHYATLCELLPVSMPSLASCLRLLTKPDTTPAEEVVCETLPSDQWAGQRVARGIHTFVMLRDRALGLVHGDLVATWLNSWQIEYDYTNPMQIESIRVAAKQLVNELQTLRTELIPGLLGITGKRSTDEWSNTFLVPQINNVNELLKLADQKSKTEPCISPLNTMYHFNKYMNVL